MSQATQEHESGAIVETKPWQWGLWEAVASSLVLLGALCSPAILRPAVLLGWDASWWVYSVFLIPFWPLIWRDFTVSGVAVTAALFHSLLTLAVVLINMCLAWAPLSNAWTGNLERMVEVRLFVEDIRDKNGIVPISAQNAISGGTHYDILYQADLVRRGSLYGDEFARAMLSFKLLEMERDPRVARAKRLGWMPMSDVKAIGGELRGHPPQQQLRSSPLHQEAYLRLVGEASLETPIGGGKPSPWKVTPD